MKYFVFTVISFLHLSTAIDYDGWLNIKIEHALACGNEKFCSRGNIFLKSVRSGVSAIEQKTFNKNHIEELEELAELDSFYTLKTICTSADNKEIEFLSSLKAQEFLEQGLSDVINAWVLPNGALVSVTFQADNSTQMLVPGRSDYKVNSKFFLRYVDQAPIPDTATYIQKLEREREAREKGELKDNRSFLAKYWMYIVPVAIFVMISGAANPEPTAQSAR